MDDLRTRFGMSNTTFLGILKAEGARVEALSGGRIRIDYDEHASYRVGTCTDYVEGEDGKRAVDIVIGVREAQPDQDPLAIGAALGMAGALGHEIGHALLYVNRFHGDPDIGSAAKYDRMIIACNPSVYGIRKRVSGEVSTGLAYFDNLNEMFAEKDAPHRIARVFGDEMLFPGADGGRMACDYVNDKLFVRHDDLKPGLRVKKPNPWYYIDVDEPFKSLQEIDAAFDEAIKDRVERGYYLDDCVRLKPIVDDFGVLAIYGTDEWRKCYASAAGERDPALQRRKLAAIALALHPEYGDRYRLTNEEKADLDFQGLFGRKPPNKFRIKGRLREAEILRINGVARIEAAEKASSGLDRVINPDDPEYDG